MFSDLREFNVLVAVVFDESKLFLFVFADSIDLSNSVLELFPLVTDLSRLDLDVLAVDIDVSNAFFALVASVIELSKSFLACVALEVDVSRFVFVVDAVLVALLILSSVAFELSKSVFSPFNSALIVS